MDDLEFLNNRSNINETETDFIPLRNSHFTNPLESLSTLKNELKTGLTSLKSELSLSHALEDGEKNYHAKKQEFEFSLVSKVFGSQQPLIFQQERLLASQLKRLPGLRSSYLHLDVLLGRDEVIDFSDFLQGLLFKLSDPFHIPLSKPDLC